MIDQRTRLTSEGLLSLTDLAEYLACSRTFAANLIADGSIPSFKIGTLRRVRKSDVDDYIERQLPKNER